MDRLMASWWSDDDYSGAGAGDFLGHDYRFSGSDSGDLYEVVARGGGLPRVHRPEVLPRVPPSEDEMAGWLHPIIAGGQDHADDEDVADQATDDDGVARAEESNTNREFTEKLDKKLPTVMQNKLAEDIITDSRAGRKQTGGEGGARRSNYAVAHSQTEKRRRSKINGSLKALQQLVPGCDKQSNQALTLDNTIQYLKSLQHQVQSMSVSLQCSMRPVTFAPGIHVRPAAVLGVPPPMVPFAPMVPGVMMPAPMVYRPAAAPDVEYALWP